MRFVCLIVLLAPLIFALTIPKSTTVLQEILIDENPRLDKEKVPGTNPMYFTRAKRVDQLFGILDFEVSPYPLIRDRRIFFYLNGETSADYEDDFPGLADATLEIHLSSVDGGDSYSLEEKINNFRIFTVRDENDYMYGGPLVLGRNEMVGDFYLLHSGSDHGTESWDIEVVARLPDSKILFSFGGRVEYPY